MKRLWKAFFFLCLASCLLFVSCATRTVTEYETVEVEVPVPVTIDITDIVRPVLEQRPDNSTLRIYPGPILTFEENVRNGLAYHNAWLMWQNYAEALEQAIGIIGERLSVGE